MTHTFLWQTGVIIRNSLLNPKKTTQKPHKINLSNCVSLRSCDWQFKVKASIIRLG